MDGSTRPVAVLNFPRERCPNLSDSCVNGQQCTVNVCLPLINDYRVLWISVALAETVGGSLSASM